MLKLTVATTAGNKEYVVDENQSITEIAAEKGITLGKTTPYLNGTGLTLEEVNVPLVNLGYQADTDVTLVTVTKADSNK